MNGIRGLFSFFCDVCSTVSSIDLLGAVFPCADHRVEVTTSFERTGSFHRLFRGNWSRLYIGV